MNKYFLRKIRDRGVKLVFYLDMGKAKVNVINTLLLVVTMVAVLELGEMVMLILGSIVIVLMVLFGYTQDRTGDISKEIEIKTLRNLIIMGFVKKHAKMAEDIEEIKTKLL